MNEFTDRYGRYALIAGASEGVGACFARALAEKGLDLVLVSRSDAKLAPLADEIRTRSGRDVRYLALDLSDPASLEKIKSQTSNLEVGTLIYNAGAETRPHTPMVDGDLAWYRYLVALNVTGPLVLAHYFGGKLKARGRGAIVLVGSLGGCCGSFGNLVYGATKAFEHTLAEGLWSELEPHGVHVAGLILGLTDTPALRRNRPQIDFSHAMKPEAIVSSVLERLDEGPILFPEGVETLAEKIMKLPRRPIVEDARERIRQFYKGKT
jgi:short-subunit dehydrogenase